MIRWRRTIKKGRPYLYPLLLTLIAILGGASREWLTVHTAMALFASIGLIIVCVSTKLESYTASLKTGLMFFSLVMGLAILQIIPLPKSIWSALPDRQEILNGFTVLDLQISAYPLSMFPQATMQSASAFIMPFFVFVVFSLMQLKKIKNILTWTFPIIAALSAILGLLQLYLGAEGSLYLYKNTNLGSPVGLFANANHQATLMLTAIPFIFVLTRQYVTKLGRSDTEISINLLVFALAILVLVGLISAGSLAGYLLAIPITLASFFRLLFKRHAGSLVQKLVGASIVLSMGVVVFLVAGNSMLGDLGVTSFDENPTSRITMIKVSMEVLTHHWIFGTGFGAYPDVYRLYEDEYAISSKFVNHSHNDFLEWAIETGVFGVLILTAFIAWLAREGVKNLKDQEGSCRHIKIAATFALLAICLHSICDYPLRTPAIAAIAAACLAIMVKAEVVTQKPQTASSKNIVI